MSDAKTDPRTDRHPDDGPGGAYPKPGQSHPHPAPGGLGTGTKNDPVKQPDARPSKQQ